MQYAATCSTIIMVCTVQSNTLHKLSCTHQTLGTNMEMAISSVGISSWGDMSIKISNSPTHFSMEYMFGSLQNFWGLFIPANSCTPRLANRNKKRRNTNRAKMNDLHPSMMSRTTLRMLGIKLIIRIGRKARIVSKALYSEERHNNSGAWLTPHAMSTLNTRNTEHTILIQNACMV